MSYYESLARTWRGWRSFGARVIAGDRDAGAAFLDEIEPFIWRRYLDYAVLDDMKLMLQREPKTPELYGFNVKKGAGGHKGRLNSLCMCSNSSPGGVRKLCAHLPLITALTALAQQHWIRRGICGSVNPPLLYFAGGWNTAIQMLHDAHNHQLPRNAHGFAQLARFSGHDDSDQFRTAIHALTDAVIENTAQCR